MRLEDDFDLLNGDLPSIIDGVEGLREGFATLRTFEALIAFARSVVLMGFRVVTVGTLHLASPDSSDDDDESHVCLVHDPFVRQSGVMLLVILVASFWLRIFEFWVCINQCSFFLGTFPDVLGQLRISECHFSHTECLNYFKYASAGFIYGTSSLFSGTR